MCVYDGTQFYYKTDLMIRNRSNCGYMSFNITFHVKRYWVHFSCFGISEIVSKICYYVNGGHYENKTWWKAKLDETKIGRLILMGKYFSFIKSFETQKILFAEKSFILFTIYINKILGHVQFVISHWVHKSSGKCF